MEIRDNLKYTKDHEWILIEGDVVTIGITDFAQNNLGDVVFLELPEAGTEVEQGETVGTIESVKAVADLYSPVTGEVIESNVTLEDEPELVNSAPYEGGWLIKVKVDPASLDSSELMDAAAYQALAQ